MSPPREQADSRGDRVVAAAAPRAGGRAVLGRAALRLSAGLALAGLLAAGGAGSAAAAGPPACSAGATLVVESGAATRLPVPDCADPDGGRVVLRVEQEPRHGTLYGPLRGPWRFEADEDYTGLDRVALSATDSEGETAEVTLLVRVTLARDSAEALCVPRRAGEHCADGGGRRTPGGGGTGKVPHRGWPAVTGILWKVVSGGRGAHRKEGGADNDELLGHHGDDRLSGGAGSDILWGDWDPGFNPESQRDVLRGGPGNDWLYSSHGFNDIDGGSGTDHVWAYYGRGRIDCGPGRHDVARIRLGAPYRVRNCETIGHFCAFGPDGHGGCLKPGETASTEPRRARRPRLTGG